MAVWKQPGVDFVDDADRASFPSPISDYTLTFRTAAGDDEVEPVKIAHVELSDPQGSPAPIITSPKVADVVILDVDGDSRVAFMFPAYSVYSNLDSVKLVVVRLGAKTLPETVTYETVDGTAKAGEHYGAKSGKVEIPAGKRDATTSISIPILRNFDEKDNVEFTVRLGDGSPEPAAGPQEVTVEIRNLQTGDFAKPFTDFHIPKDGGTYGRNSFKAKEAHVFSDDGSGSGVKVVELALRKKIDGGGCRWWNGSRWRVSSCRQHRADNKMNLWGMSKKARSSSFSIFKYPKLKPTQGTKVRNYRVISRATDFSANVESKFTKGFNIRTFKISK